MRLSCSRFVVLLLAVGGLLVGRAAAQPVTGKFTTYGKACVGTGGLPGTCVVLPKAYATKMGQTANTFPHARSNMRYQQMFLGSEVGRVGIFVELCLRLDEGFGGPAQTQDIELKLGYTAKTQATFSTVFASNYAGGSPQTVFKGKVALPAHRRGGTVQDFKICFKFARPWIWLRSGARPNLLTEWLNTSTASRSHFEDKCQRTLDCTTTRVWAPSVTATSGRVERHGGLVMCLRRAGPSGAAPALANKGVPFLGRPFDVTLASAAARAPAVMFLGRRIAVPLPPTKCTLLTTLTVLAATVVADASGAATQRFTIPNVRPFKGVTFALQWIVIDAQANALGLAFSNGGEGVVGGR